MRLRATIAALLLACSAAHAQTPMRDDKAASPADREFMAAMTKMQQDMNAPMTGNPDRDFVAMMIPHHQGAIEMARIELHYGKDEQLRSLAREIIAAQEKEIAVMKRWQARHGEKHAQ